MKEQWKKLDSDAKLLLNIEEGRTVPIKIELPISALASHKPDCCKRLITTLRVSVLLALLLLLGWTAKIVSINYYYEPESVKSLNDEPLFDSLENKQAFRQKAYEYDSLKTNSQESNDVEVTSQSSDETHFETFKITESTPEEAESNTNDEIVLKQLLFQERKQLTDLFKSLEKVENEEKTIEEEKSGENVSNSASEIPDAQNNSSDEKFIETILNEFFNEITAQSSSSTGDMGSNSEEFTPESKESSEVDSFEKGFQKELDEVNKVIGNLFETAASAFFDELMKDVGESDESTNKSEEKEEEISENENSHENSVNIEETLTNGNQGSIEPEEDINENKISQESQDEQKNYSFESKEDLENTSEGNVSTQWKELEDKSTMQEEDLEVSEVTSQRQEEDGASVEDRSIDEDAKNIGLACIVAKRLEPIVGENYELLLWYLANKDKPIFEHEDPLKVYTAKMLYSTNIREFPLYLSVVLSLIDHDSFMQKYENLSISELAKIRPETEVQKEIVFRLIDKSSISKKLMENESSFEETIFSELLQAYNDFDEKKALEPIYKNEENQSSTTEATTESSVIEWDNSQLGEEKHEVIEEINNSDAIDNNSSFSKEEPEINVEMNNSNPIDDHLFNNEEHEVNGEINDSESIGEPSMAILKAMRQVGNFDDKSESTESLAMPEYYAPNFRHVPIPLRPYYSDEDVLGLYDPMFAGIQEPAFPKPKPEPYLLYAIRQVAEHSATEAENKAGEENLKDLGGLIRELEDGVDKVFQSNQNSDESSKNWDNQDDREYKKYEDSESNRSSQEDQHLFFNDLYDY